MTNCMLHSKELSPRSWEKAINCEKYIINYTPTKAFNNIKSE